jgi:methanogenic corrinoid protein MtbC1
VDTFGQRLKKIRKEKKLRQKDLANALGLAQTTIANYEQNMRFPDHKKLNKIANHLSVSLDYLLGREEKNTISKVYIEKKEVLSLSERSNYYLKALLQEDKDGAKKIIEEAVLYGNNITDIYLHVLEPALKEIGRRWSINDVSIAQEHFCSFVTQQIMSQIFTKSVTKKKCKAVAVAVSGELHEIGLKMVSDFFEMDGWDVYYLGSNTPTKSIIEAIEFTKADILIISATLSSYVDAVENLIKVIRLEKECEETKIIVGGQAFNKDKGLWEKVGADGYSVNAKEAIKIANRLVSKRQGNR